MTRCPAALDERWEGGGEQLLIRPIRPLDAAELDAFFHRLTPGDIRLRFFAALRELTPAQLAKLTRLDYDRDMALIATREATGEILAVARLVREDDPRLAEFAVVVQHEMQGRGVATHLLQRLLHWASRHDVSEVGQILAENSAMLDLARRLGFRLRHLPESPDVIEAQLSLAALPAGLSGLPRPQGPA